MPVRGAAERGATYDDDASEAARFGDLEFTPTPAGPIRALFSTFTFSRTLLDPCCGDGAMLREFTAHGYRAIGAEIRPDACPGAVVADYLEGENPFPNEPADIVTNPPFGAAGRLAERFIGKALERTRPYRGSVAMLLGVDFDSAATRTILFRDHPAYAGKLVLLRRIVWYDEPVICKPCGGEGRMPIELGSRITEKCKTCRGSGETKPSPAMNHAWYLWDWGRPPGDPVTLYATWKD